MGGKLSQQQVEFAVERLEQHHLFSSLTPAELTSVCEEMMYARAQDSRYIFRQGEVGSCFFLIYRGRVEVEVDGKLVRTLERGETFGELALLFRAARSASIACSAAGCEFLIMKPALYRKTLQKMKLEE